MKKIELELKKRLLIVEVPRLEDYEFINKDSKYLKVGNVEINLNIPTLSKLELICKGYELKEEIAKDFIKNMIDNSELNFLYKNHRKNEKGFVFSALKSFTSAIEAQGYYWGEHNVKIPYSTSKGFDECDENGRIYDDVLAFQEAKNKTFNPEKTLIFEILL